MLDSLAVRSKLLVRSLQVRVPRLRSLKETTGLRWQVATKRPHDADFRVIPLLGPPADALYLDVGANLGQSVLSIRSQDPGARVVAFEPNTSLTANLMHLLPSGARVRVEPFALGEGHGRFLLHIPSYNGWVFHGLASLDRGEAESWLDDNRMLNFDRSRLEVEELSCEVRPLDDFDLDPWFIKVDVQGTESAVIAGGARTIARSEPVIMLEATPFCGVVREVLEPLGYEPAVRRHGALVSGDRDATNIFYIPRRLTDRIHG